MKSRNFCCSNLRLALTDKELPIVITRKTDCFGKDVIALKWRVNCLLVAPLYFCPWCGDGLSQGFFCALRQKMALLTEENLPIFESCFNFETDIPQNLQYFLRSRDWWKREIMNQQLEHKAEWGCYSLKDDIEQDVPIVYNANIRTFGIIKRKKIRRTENLEGLKEIKENTYFVSINYCYYCGAKLPDRLDEMLTKILQSEYGLESWKDYKRAPPEFHTDEWWKKLGL